MKGRQLMLGHASVQQTQRYVSVFEPVDGSDLEGPLFESILTAGMLAEDAWKARLVISAKDGTPASKARIWLD